MAEKGIDIYERLADALNALPGGFPRMKSGVEIRLIKKAFTPEQVEVAGVLSRKYQTAAEIAAKVGMAEDKVVQIINSMARLLGIVRPRVNDKGVTEYRLGPFILGWYEGHMDKMDKEFAELFEQYLKEGGGERILAPQPGILGVVPVRGSLKPELLQPYDDIDAHFQRHERFMVMNCVCRVEQNLLDSKCKTPVQRCAFVGLPPQMPLSETILDREQAMKLFDKIERMGLVHLGFYGFIMGAASPQFIGTCNCCGDCCGILRAVNDLGLSEGPQRSNYRAAFNMDICDGLELCGRCIKRCQVHAIAEGKDDKPEYSRDRCIGCGQCVIGCPSKAVELVPVSAEEWFHVPASFEEWEEIRLRNMGMEP